MTSRAVGYREIYCDACGNTYPLAHVLEVVRKRAAADGWTFHLVARPRGPARTLDICPGCPKPTKDSTNG